MAKLSKKADGQESPYAALVIQAHLAQKQRVAGYSPSSSAASRSPDTKVQQRQVRGATWSLGGSNPSANK